MQFVAFYFYANVVSVDIEKKIFLVSNDAAEKESTATDDESSTLMICS